MSLKAGQRPGDFSRASSYSDSRGETPQNAHAGSVPDHRSSPASTRAAFSPAVHFAESPTSTRTSPLLAAPTHNRKDRTKPLDLRLRLYDRPENSEAVRVIQHQQIQGGQGDRQAPLLKPRPPSGRSRPPQAAFRTTIYRRDYDRRQLQKFGDDILRPPPLSVDRLHKAKVPLPPVTTPPPDRAESDAASEVDRLSPNSDDNQSEISVTSPFKSEKKVVSFQGVPMTPKEPTSELLQSSHSLGDPSPRASPDELSTPLPGPRGVSATPQGSSRAGSARRVTSATRQQDPSLVLTYLKKNIYDDQEPDQDDFYEVLLEMRSRLGWINDLPRYGPGCREKVDRLVDKPSVDEDVEGAVKAKDDDGKFVYALPRDWNNPQSRYNPYDLQVVSANTARTCDIYYTATASNINRVVVTSEGKEESTRTKALEWMWERKLFYMIKELPVFIKFRRWKAFHTWLMAVRGQKNVSSKCLLQRTLFTANEVLQGCVIHVRRLCEAASGSLTGHGHGEASISLVRLQDKTLTLSEFMQDQHDQADLALSQLNALRDKVVEMVFESCATVAEMEGVTQGIRPEGEKHVTIATDPPGNGHGSSMYSKNVRYKLRTKFGDIPVGVKKNDGKSGKSNKPTYAQIAEWRKILERLSYFLRSVDYLMLELLRRLVLTSTRILTRFVVGSFQTGMTEDANEQVQSQWPLFDTEGFPSPQDLSASESGSDSEGDEPVSRNSYIKVSQSTSTSTMSQKSSRTSGQSKAPPGQLLIPGYNVPRYDFTQVEEPVETLDVSKVLQEISQQKETVEIPEPILSLQLVLSVPELTQSDSKHSHRRPSSKSVVIAESADAKAQTSSATETNTSRDRRKSLNEVKKAVKFTEDADSGTDDSDYGSEYTDEDEAEEGGNRFAYNEEYKTSSSSRVVVKPQKASVCLMPSEQQVKEGMRAIINNFEHTVGQVGSMLKEPRLAPFYSTHKFDLQLTFDAEVREEEEEDERPWPDTQHVFGDDPEYQGLIMELMEHVSDSLDMVLEYSQDFDKYCDMVDRARKVDVVGSMANKKWSTEEFQHVLAIHSEQIHHMQRMMKRRRLGLIVVLSSDFCESCLPYPRDVMSSVNSKLPVIALHRNEDLLTIIKGASKKLGIFPTSVEEFVEHLSFLGKMSSEMPALDREYNVVNKLYTIARDYEVQIAPEEFALYQTVSPSFQHLKSIILYAEAKKDDNIRKFSTDLDNLIHDIRSKISDFKNRVQDPVLLHGDTMATTALEKIHDLTEEVTELTTKARSYGNYQERFGSSLTQTSRKNFSEEFLLQDKRDDSSAQEIQTDLSELERDLTLRRLLWDSQVEWEKLSKEWTSGAFDQLNVESLQKNVNRFTQTVYMLEKGLPHNEVIPRLKEKVLDFKQVMPCITSLRNPSLKGRHWDQIERIIGKSIVRNKEFTLGDLLEMNIIKHKEKIQDISTTASNEGTLERMLQKIIDLWQITSFRLVPHASGNVFIIAGADDILAMLEESQVTIGTIRGSRYVTPIKGAVEEWERKLTMFGRTLEEWMICQRNWLYLEQIFTTPDIQRQLPSESKLFAAVDKSWKDIMRKTEDRPNALKSSTAPGILDMLQAANSNLEKIQKCLEDYLETKRLVFPRFYFLSNDELLDILAQSKNPDAVQPHLGKCFGNIKSLDIKQLPRQPPTVKSMTSAEGEIVVMPKNVRARGPVEQWLGGVESGMSDTVKRHLKLGLQDWLGIGHDEWVLKHPGQVVLTVAQIIFNKDVTMCFNASDPRHKLIELRGKTLDTLHTLAVLVSSNLVVHKRLSINALLTVDVHNRDVISTMIDCAVDKRDDFEWTRQLRYEWDEQSNNCNVLQSNASFLYGYEYLGCSPRLVITPLTDRCYLTLTGALHLHLGGSPAGPAGTGKTETVKDLGKAMGKQCVVFNCSEGLDYKMLGKFFSGLAQSGSWICFDEFNRIDVEVLSVVAQQIHTIKTAKDQIAPRFMFEGRDIKLNPTCGFFVTMNPSYAGRVELPDNLKSLFRPVAMMVPDYALIAEIMLFSEGFLMAKYLSTKIVNLYQLASKQLSQQDHYDFGMRAIKSVLVMAGQRKRLLQITKLTHKRNQGLDEDVEISMDEESHILIHSLRDANLPKFLAEDVPLFESIMADLFPGVDPPQPHQEALEKAISMAVRDQGLQHWPNQIEKVKQLHSQILVRHGVMLVGPTGGGKTTIRNILQRALVILPTVSSEEDSSGMNKAEKRRLAVYQSSSKAKKGHVETFTLNPKCVKLGELYGETDPNTFEWTDGLIATATRRFAKEISTTPVDDVSSRPQSSISATQTSVSQITGQTDSTTPLPTISVSSEVFDDARSKSAKSEASSMSMAQQAAVLEGAMDSIPTSWNWMVLDGPVDTLWVENLNTVLDDSKVLCLANGERITLTHGMRLLFEVDDLSQASPATISRCAMVYMDPVDLGWKPTIKTWLNRLPREIPESGRQHLQALFDHSMDRALGFFRQNYKQQMVPIPEQSLINCLCNILSAFLDFMGKHGGYGAPDKDLMRPPSAESESSHSRSSSRTGSRTGSRSDRKRRKGRRAGHKRGDDQLHTIKEKEKKPHKAHSGLNQTEKQYYLERNPSALNVLLGKLYVFALTWSFGGNFSRQDELDDDGGIGRKGGDRRDLVEVDIATEFDNFVHELFEVEPPLGVRLPASSKSIYSFFVDMDSGGFIPWEALVPKTQSLIEKGAVITIGETMGVSSSQQQQKASQTMDIVTTVDTVRYSFLSSLLVLNKCPVLLTGESGVGKTAVIKYLLKRLEKEGGTSFKSGTILGSVFNFTDQNQAILNNISSLTKLTGDDDGDQSMELLLGGASRPKIQTGLVSSMLQFSAQTTAGRTQLALTHKLIKKGRDTLGAPKGKKVVVFVDDLNMPAPEVYGAQPPLELLRQFMDLGGFYDTKKLVWKDVLDVTLIAACGPPGGGRNQVSPRLLKHFCTLALPQPSTRSLQHIYQVQLGRFFQEGEFTPEVKGSLFHLVSASIAIYYRMLGSMRPTPTKIHYTFNIRDLSQVVCGLLQADETVIVNNDNCAQLFAHEASRVFQDRLVCQEDRSIFYNMLADNCHDYFKVKWTPEQLMSEPILFADFLEVADGTSRRTYKPINDRVKLTQVLEELYMRQNVGNTQVPQMVFFKDAVEHILRAARIFRQPGGHMLLVGMDGTGKSTTIQLAAYVANCDLCKVMLTRSYSIQDFRDDIKKVCLRSGVKGQNTVFLLTDGDIVKESFLEDINCILNSGEVPDLFDNEEVDGIAMDLKSAAAEAAVPDTRPAVYQLFIERVKKNLHIVLAMSPVGSKFRQRCRMNPSLINCCTIDWYDEWDKEAMLSVANVYFQNLDFTTTENEDSQVIENLKVKVAHTCVDIHSSIAVATKQFYEELRRYFYVTPSSYMELIRVYSHMLRDKRDGLMNNRQRLLVGLSRLSEANSLVGTMQEELVALGPKIEEKAKDTERLLEQLGKDQEAVDQVRAIVEGEEAVMKRETQIVQEYADECQRDLASVIPALQTAIESLDSLNKADISEVRTFVRPPVMVSMVMGAVCILLEAKPDWATAKQILGDPQFLKRLITFDKNAVPEKVFTKLKKYSKHPDFNPKMVQQVSSACTSMCMWVLALEHYHEVYKMAKPKQKKVEDAKEALTLAENNLAQKQASLAKIQNHLKMLQQQYQDSVEQREALKERKRLTALRLERASVLIGALSDEKVRWSESVKDLDFKLQGLVGDSLVSAGAVAYLGAFTSKFRHELLSQWSGLCITAHVPISEKYDFVKGMLEANEILRWQNEGLPQDTHSTENAIIIKRAHKWPLMIDPQGQASMWIREMEGTKLKVAEANDPNYMRVMERAIRVGDAVLLQEVTEDLDPSLKPILAQETFVSGGNTVMKLGDTEIEYNSNFRLYLSTTLSNPHYLPSVCIQVSIINFTVTFDGLQEQLLSGVVKQERPQLEYERSAILESITDDLQLLRDLEDKCLGLLQTTKGHILDDQVLVETLQRSKGMSEEITVRVAQSEDAEKKLNSARQKYLPVATRGAVLYFVLANLANIDVMYQFSLSWFQSMFVSCIDITQVNPLVSATQKLSGSSRPVSSKSRSSHASLHPSHHGDKGVAERRPLEGAELQEHMAKMIDRLTTNIYKIVSVALFAHHKLTFSFLLCSSIMRAKPNDSGAAATTGGNRDGSPTFGVISEEEWMVFLQGSVLSNMLDEDVLKEHDGLSAIQRLECESKGVIPPRPKWLNSSMWRQCQHLQATFPAFSLLCRSILNNHSQWNAFYESDSPYSLMQSPPTAQDPDTNDPHQVTFPWETLSGFQHLLLIKILQPAMFIAAVYKFVIEQMGTEFVQTGTFDLREMFEESNAKTPLIFILSPGSDPGSQLIRFAKDLRGTSLHLDMISLGRGQGPKAEELIHKAQILKGRWLFLQNCHLAASWMPRLQNIVDGFNKPGTDIDPQFRLWLSSKPDPSFPISILQNGLKMTVEPPRGVKANLQRSFGTAGTGPVTDKYYEETCPGKPAWKKLLFSLCLFNAVIHERKKYGRLGWNIPYEFNDSDLEVSVLQLEMLLGEQEDIPWPALWYLTGEVTFGGRVTDDWDRRCLHSLLQKFYHPEALAGNHHYTPDQVYHVLPDGSSFADVKTYIEELPAQDSSELFGMNVNAEKACLETQTNELVTTILGVQPRLSKGIIGGGRSSDEIVLEMVDDMLKILPEGVEPEEGELRPGQLPKLTITDIIKVGQGANPRSLKRKKDEEAGSSSSRKDKGQTEADLLAMEDIKKICQSALFTVLRQEIDRFNNLLALIHKSLKRLTQAVRGEIVMSETLEEAYNALLHQNVPSQWKQASYESCKPLGSWMSDLVQRVDFFCDWSELVINAAEAMVKMAAALEKAVQSDQKPSQLGASGLGAGRTPSPWEHGTANQEEKLQQQMAQMLLQQQMREKHQEVDIKETQPRSFWLPAFFFPQGFLTAVLQNHARKLQVSIDSLSMEFEVLAASAETEDMLTEVKVPLKVKDIGFKGGSPPDNGVLVFGLYIDGACWDLTARTLSDSQTGQRFYRLPEIYFIPTMTSTSSPPPVADLDPVTGVEIRPRPASSTLESPLAVFRTRSAVLADADIVESYSCPLYRTSARAGTLSSTGHSTNFVTSVNLPSKQAPEFWVMRGVALLCQLDD